MQAVINHYEDYNEDGRLSRDNAHKIEFLTSIHFLNQYVQPNSNILDVGAGAGAYSFHFAEKGHSVTSIDITPKNVQQMTLRLESYGSSLNMNVGIGDGRDLSRFESGTFDVVLCMGPLYHLIQLEDRMQCVRECLRVLRKGSLLAIAYINRIGVFTHLVRQDRKYLEPSVFQRVVERGYILSSEKDCFWTDAYFSSPGEIEGIAESFGIEKVNNLATDGIGVFIPEAVNTMSPKDFNAWMQYHFRACSDPSIIGMSIHGLYIGRKK